MTCSRWIEPRIQCAYVEDHPGQCSFEFASFIHIRDRLRAIAEGEADPDVIAKELSQEVLALTHILEAKTGWQNYDPRSIIYKRANIIILRPTHILGTGFVDTKDGWDIRTSFEDHRSIDKWDPDWKWCRSPNDPWLRK